MIQMSPKLMNDKLGPDITWVFSFYFPDTKQKKSDHCKFVLLSNLLLLLCRIIVFDSHID